MLIGTTYYGRSNIPIKPSLVVVNQSGLCNHPMIVHFLAQEKAKHILLFHTGVHLW